MRRLFFLSLLALGGCGREAGKVDNAVDQALPNMQAAPDNGQPAPAPVGSLAPRSENAPSSMPSGPMPVGLRGRWTGVGDACSDAMATLALRVTADALIFPESVGRVTGVEENQQGRLAIRADFTGEGESWSRRLILHPSTDGQRLTIVQGGVTQTRKRCHSA